MPTPLHRAWIFLALSLVLISGLQAQLVPQDLICEYVRNPSVVDVAQPRLGWINVSPDKERGQRQTAYQLRVASTRDGLAQPDLWDSDKVMSDRSNRVVYQGNPLSSRQDCWWQVRVWDKDDQVSEWSEPAYWHMGLLGQDEWQAQWIGAPWQGEAPLPKPAGPGGTPEKWPPPAPLLRKTFTIDKQVERAMAYVTGLGYFEFYVNGEKIGEDVLVPNQTNYGKRPDLTEQNIPLPDDFREYKVMYLAYDITEQLERGENALGSILGNGFYDAAKYWAGSYGTPRFLGQVHLTYTDGSEEIIVSDGSWKASKGPILMDMVYYGEHYDARQEQPGWNTPDFDDSQWEPVAMRKAPEGKLVAHTPYPDRVMERLPPQSITRTDSGTYLVDFGVEISGWLRLNEVEGPRGHKVRITYNSNEYSGDNSYVFRGEGKESYAARFNWFVFSGVEIFNWPGELKPEHLTAEAVNTFVETSATFETSNPLLNEINQIWRRSQLDNMHGGLASDCPHRERSGYTGDGQVACVTVMHNFDARSFYHKWVQDMWGAQIEETGYVPNGAPWQPGCGGGVAWGAAINIMPWEFYLHYGARDMLEANYEAMKGYLRYMKTWVDERGIMHSQAVGRDGKPLRWLNLGEWCIPNRVEAIPNEFVHTFYFWYCAELTAKAAEVLGQSEEAAEYAQLAEATRQAFHNVFYDDATGSYGNHGRDVLALRMGVPDAQRPRVVEALRRNMKANDGHLDTGIFGTRFLFEVLADHGMNELAYTAITKRTPPSFGYWLEQGATTTREGWIRFGSHNHPMFGGGLVWLYRRLAGLQADPSQPGYQHMILRPQPVEELEFVTYTNRVPRGKAGIHWEQDESELRMTVSVPVGSTATVYVPARKASRVMEGSTKARKAAGVRYLRMEDGYAVFDIVSGEYEFSSPK